MAAYTRCLRCAGAPRRPASGSELSLYILSWHAVPYDPGESDHRQFQTAMSAWPSPRVDRLGTPKDPAIRSTREVNFEATWFTIRYGLPGCSPPCTDQTDNQIGPRGLLLPGFQQVGLPSRCWISLQQRLDLLCWRDSH